MRLSTFFENRLPQDFADCYRKYAEALVVARSCPMHLLSESKILAEAAQSVAMWNRKKPLRFLRFGEFHDRDSQKFGLWQERPWDKVWKAVATDPCTRDVEYYENGVVPECIMGDSFHAWLKKLIETEELPDGFLDTGTEGHFVPA